MKKILIALILTTGFFLSQENSFGGSIGDPGATLLKGKFSLGPELSLVSREISDGNNVRYDTEAWRLFLKGSYGINDWVETFGRVGAATLKIHGTSFNSSPGIAGGGGVKINFLDPPGHPLRYSLGGQFLYSQIDDSGATAKWLEYDIWAGVAYKDLKDLVPFGGIVYSRVDGKLKDFPSQPALNEFRSPTAMGIFMGLDWHIDKRMTMGVEFRGFAENSRTISLRYRF
jgi:hypothetical protein